jgi:hypothetical protein
MICNMGNFGASSYRYARTVEHTTDFTVSENQCVADPDPGYKKKIPRIPDPAHFLLRRFSYIIPRSFVFYY